MKVSALGFIIVSAALSAGCSYHFETLPSCFSDHIESTVRAVKQALASGAYHGGDIEFRHTFCSIHEDRLDVAEKLLAASGYLYDRHIAELGHCTEVPLKSPLNAEMISRKATTFCGVAAAAGVSYTDWSAPIGDRFLYVSRQYISLTRGRELPKP